MRLEELNALEASSAFGELLRCCGSTRWAALMVEARPFPGADALAMTADRIWLSLGRDDWMEAFAAHPRIGQATRSSLSPWEAAEQAGVAESARETLEKLNQVYEDRFGYMFLVCATGKTAPEILQRLRERLRNNPDDELRVAAEEQRQITRLRLIKLLT